MPDGSVLIDAKINTNPFKKGLASLGSLVSNSGLASIGAGILKGITAISAGLTAAGGFAVQAGMNFDTAMSQVAATMGVTVDEITVLSDKAKEMGATTAFSATEAAEALNYLALAGYDAETAASVLPAVLNLAAAGGMDLAYASDLATDAMSALGIAATEENLTHFGDQMAKTASKANTSVAQLGEAILTVGGTAKSLAGGTVELNTALGILANRGIKGAEGGTHLRNVILSLSAPTDTARRALKKLGVQVTDSAGNMRSLDDIMADFNKATEGMSETAKMDYLSKIFNKTDLAAVMALLSGCGEEWDSLEAEISDCEGAMADMAAVQLDNLEGDITILKSALEGLGIAAYEGVRDPLREIVQTGTGMIDQLSKAMTEGGFMGFASALGSVLSKAVTVISSYAPKMVSLAVSVVRSLVAGISENAESITTAVVEVFSTISTGIIDMLPALTKAGADILTQLLKGFAQQFPSLATKASECIGSLALALVDATPELISAAIAAVKAIGDGIIQSLPVLAAAIPQIITSIIDLLSSDLPQLLDTGIQMIVQLAKGLIDAIPTLAAQLPAIVSAIWDGLTGIDWLSLGKKLLTSIMEGLADIGTSLVDLFNTGIEAIKGIDWSSVGTTIMGALGSIGAWFSGLFDAAFMTISEIDWVSVCKAVMDALGNIGTWFSGLFDTALTAISDIDWGAVGTTVMTAIGNVGTWFSGLFDTAKTAISEIDWAGIGSTIQTGISDVGAWLSGKMSDAWTAIKGIDWAGVGSAIQTGISDVGAWVSGTLETAATSIKNINWAEVGSTIGTKIGDVGATLLGHFQNALTTIGNIDWASLYTTITGKIGDIGAWLSGCISDGWDTVINGLGTVATNLWEGLKTGLTSAWESLKDTITAPFKGVLDAIKNLFGIHSPSTEMKSIGGYLLEGLGKGLLDGVEAVLTTVGDVFGRIWDAIKKIFGFGGESEESKDAKQAGKDIMTGMKDGITGSEDEVKTAVSNAAKNALKQFRTDMGVPEGGGSSTKTKPYGEAIVTGVKDGIDTKATSATFTATGTKLAKAAFDAMDSALGTSGSGSGSASKAKPFGEAIVAGVVDGLKNKAKKSEFADASNALRDAAKSAIQTAVGMSAAGTAASQYKYAGEGIASGVVDGLSNKSKSSTFTNSANALTSAAKSALNTAFGISANSASKFLYVGEAIAAGVAQGIKNGSSKITSAANSAASAAYKAACKKLGIHSPSRLFAEVGLYCGKGLAQGLENSQNVVAGAMGDLTDTLANTDIASRIEQAVAGRSKQIADAYTGLQTRLDSTDGSTDGGIDYDELGRAVWDNAPELGAYLDGEKVADLIEPRVSRRQGQKTNQVNRRNGRG